MLPVEPVMLGARVQEGKTRVVPLTLPERQLKLCRVFLQKFHVASQLAGTGLHLCINKVSLQT